MTRGQHLFSFDASGAAKAATSKRQAKDTSKRQEDKRRSARDARAAASTCCRHEMIDGVRRVALRGAPAGHIVVAHPVIHSRVGPRHVLVHHIHVRRHLHPRPRECYTQSKFDYVCLTGTRPKNGMPARACISHNTRVMSKGRVEGKESEGGVERWGEGAENTARNPAHESGDGIRLNEINDGIRLNCKGRNRLNRHINELAN